MVDAYVERAKALAIHDSQRAVFGASMHDWRHEMADGIAFEQMHRCKLPQTLLDWLQAYGTGAGPFYGLQLEAPDKDLLRLTEHGCGYSDYLQLSTGEIWADDGGQLHKWFDSVDAWLQAWLDYAEAEWATCYLQDGVEDTVEPDFLSRCLRAVERVLEEPASPLLAAYPLDARKLHLALAHGALHDGNLRAAKRALQAATEASQPGQAMDALAKIFIAKAQGNAEAGLAAAEEGLRRPGLYHDARGKLLCEKQVALSALDRDDEHDAMFSEIADHFTQDLHKQYDHAWILLAKGEPDAAAARLLAAANHGVGCQENDPLPKRLREVSGGLEQALQQAGFKDRAAALHSAIARQLN